jgi:hypothetical protein
MKQLLATARALLILLFVAIAITAAALGAHVWLTDDHVRITILHG